MTQGINTDDFGDMPAQQHAQPARKVDLGNVDDAMSSGVPAAKFERIGDTVKGVILSCEMAQQRDMATGKPTFWNDGNPKTQVLIVLETQDRNPDIEDDNGHRQLYAKKPGVMLKAIATALGKVKLSQSIGGTLAVKHSGEGQPIQKGFNKPKLYVAKFWPKESGASSAVDANNARLSAMQLAWSKFKSERPNANADALSENWKRLFAAYFPGKTKDQLGEQDWLDFAGDNFVRADGFDSPASEGGAGIPIDDVPFAHGFNPTFI